MPNSRDMIFGCVLMGGQSRRFGGADKSQLRIGEATLLDHVIIGARDQVERLALGASQNGLHHDVSSGLPVLNDEYEQIGPMAGLHAAMKWAQPDAGFIATFACDTPSFPADMVEQLSQAAQVEKADVALPRHNGRIHTALGLWSTKLLPQLIRAIDANQLALTRWALDMGAVLVDFDGGPQQNFFNINSPQDAEHYRSLTGV